MKSEPDVFGIEHLRRQKVAPWDGVRNCQARNFLRAMRQGDQAFFYHSSTSPAGIAGLIEIVREAYPDPTQFDPKNAHYDSGSDPKDPRWSQVDVKFLEAFPQLLSLQQMRGMPELQGMVLLTRGRLSVQPVTEAHWRVLLDYLRR